jgi:hypothetical protein
MAVTVREETEGAEVEPDAVESWFGFGMESEVFGAMRLRL